MSRGGAERPIRRSDPEVGLQAALRQAAERGAAPATAAGVPGSGPPAVGDHVAETAPLCAVTGVPRQRGARSFVLSKVRKKGKKESLDKAKLPDPRGRGSVLDFRI